MIIKSKKTTSYLKLLDISFLPVVKCQLSTVILDHLNSLLGPSRTKHTHTVSSANLKSCDTNLKRNRFVTITPKNKKSSSRIHVNNFSSEINGLEVQSHQAAVHPSANNTLHTNAGVTISESRECSSIK